MRELSDSSFTLPLVPLVDLHLVITVTYKGVIRNKGTLPNKDILSRVHSLRSKDILLSNKGILSSKVHTLLSRVHSLLHKDILPKARSLLSRDIHFNKPPSLHSKDILPLLTKALLLSLIRTCLLLRIPMEERQGTLVEFLHKAVTLTCEGLINTLCNCNGSMIVVRRRKKPDGFVGQLNATQRNTNWSLTKKRALKGV